MSTKTETPQGVGTEDLLGEIARLRKELADEKADHADTQAKWNEALDTGLKVVEERDRLAGLLRLEELARGAERRACEALEAENRALREDNTKLAQGGELTPQDRADIQLGHEAVRALSPNPKLTGPQGPV